MNMSNWWNPVLSTVRQWARSASRMRRKVPRPNRRLAVEVLEDRNLPSSSFSQAFVEQVYTDLLHRSADSAGLAAWSGMIDAGVSPMRVVLDIESSSEFRSDVVENAYQTLLGRAADPVGLSYWAAFLQTNPIEKMEAGIAGSSEFFQNAGGTTTGFLNAIYLDLLDRGVDSSGQAAFGQELSSGKTTAFVASQILASQEYQQDLVNSYYMQFLHRSADAPGLASWVGVLESGGSDQESGGSDQESGGSDQTVIASIISSTEYATRMPAVPVVTVPASAESTTATSFTIGGTAENGSLVQIYTNANGNGVVGSGDTLVGSEQLVGAQTAFSIGVPLAASTANSFLVTATNGFGNASAATTVPTITTT